MCYVCSPAVVPDSAGGGAARAAGRGAEARARRRAGSARLPRAAHLVADVRRGALVGAPELRLGRELREHRHAGQAHLPRARHPHGHHPARVRTPGASTRFLTLCL